jgi:sulfopyruvate decarboxylase subunit alpha
MNLSDKNVFNTLSCDRSEKADKLHRVFRELGVNFASGVPCGVLRHIIKNFDNDIAMLHVIANRESEAVGIAAGAYLGGKIPVVYMQNSGLFSASNDIASLLVPYGMPIFFVVSYRGCEGEDAIQHLTTGRATERLLESFGLPFVIFGDQNLETLMRLMFETMRKAELPTFLLLKRGWYQ